LELAFSEKPLRDICESEATAKRKLGIYVARELKRCLADLHAAPSIGDLPGARFQKGEDSCAFDLTGGYRLVVIPNHLKMPLLDSGAIQWAVVKRIKIIRIACDGD
jgi:proteic killer suppression protein